MLLLGSLHNLGPRSSARFLPKLGAIMYLYIYICYYIYIHTYLFISQIKKRYVKCIYNICIPGLCIRNQIDLAFVCTYDMYHLCCTFYLYAKRLVPLYVYHCTMYLLHRDCVSVSQCKYIVCIYRYIVDRFAAKKTEACSQILLNP